MTDASRRRARPVLMIVHAYYEEDPRVRREAESLVEAGRPVQVLGLRQAGRSGDVGGRRACGVHHLDVQRHQGAGLGVYLREYLSFLARAMFAAVRLHRRERFALVQVHSLPDFLVFAALPLRLVGVPVLLDLHEAMPEFFRSRFPGASNPRRASTADAPGTAVDRGIDRDHHRQPGDARSPRRARRAGGEGRGRGEQPVARAVRRSRAPAAVGSGRTVDFGSSTPGR